jgi:hypothetical protein
LNLRRVPVPEYIKFCSRLNLWFDPLDQLKLTGCSLGRYVIPSMIIDVSLGNVSNEIKVYSSLSA